MELNTIEVEASGATSILIGHGVSMHLYCLLLRTVTFIFHTPCSFCSVYFDEMGGFAIVLKTLLIDCGAKCLTK